MTAGHIYTIAGDGTAGYSGNSHPATSARLNSPEGVAVDATGSLIIADTGNDRVRAVAATSGTFYGQAMTAGDIYPVAGDGTAGSSGSGGLALNAELGTGGVGKPDTSFDLNGGNVAVDGGNYVVAESSRAWFICQVSGTYFGQAMTAGHIYAVAGNGTAGYSGDGGPALSAELDWPEGVAVDAAGNLIIADTRNYAVRVVAASTGTFYGQAMTAGDIYTVAEGVVNGAPELYFPQGVAVDAAGNLIVVCGGGMTVNVVAATSGTFYGQAMTAGDTYTIAGTAETFGFSGDGGPAASALLYRPGGVAVDGAGNLVIADSSNDRIRVIAATSGTFYGQAMTAGDIYTVAGGGTGGVGDGGPARSAKLDSPHGVAVDAAGNLVIADTNNDRIRVVAATSGTFYGQAMTAGDIYTVAGDGLSGSGFPGNGSPATSARLYSPEGVAVDAAGNLVIADNGTDWVRVVSG